MMTYSMEYKSKSQLIQEQEDEDAKEKKMNKARYQIESETIVLVLQLFLVERLQSYKSVLNLNQDKIDSQIKEILRQIFQI